MPCAGPLTYGRPWGRPQGSSGFSFPISFPPGACLPWPILLTDFSGGNRKFPVAQGTGQGKRAGVHPPLGNWPPGLGEQPWGEIRQPGPSHIPGAPAPNLSRRKHLSQRRIESCHHCSRNSLCCSRPVKRGYRRDWEGIPGSGLRLAKTEEDTRASQPSRAAAPLPRCFSNSSTEAQTVNRNPKCLEA